MSHEDSNKRQRRSSPEHESRPRAASDSGVRGVRLPLNSSAVADASEQRDGVLPEQPNTPDHPPPIWVRREAARSPSKVVGRVLQVGGDFGDIARKSGLIVDKTLICKALIDYKVEAICICLPRRFGKTFNLSIVEEFFNVVTGNDIEPVNGIVNLAAGQAERMKLFKNSLLLNEHPAFFDKHFCRYPVIRLNFKEVTASTIGNFYCTLARALHRTTARWLQRLKGVSLPAETLERYRRIPRACDDMEISFAEADQYWESQSSTADALFSWLSGLLREVYDSPYIVLFDEYDIPLKAIRGKAWGREAAETYTSLISMIFKNNKDLKCGLLVGIYKMSLVDIGSGANCVHFLPLTVHGYHSGLNENGEQPCDLVEAFAHDETEVRLLVEAARQQYDLISKFSTESIMATLTRWYDGYTFGRTGGKFNPYAVAMFLRELKRSSNIDSATQDYWRDTGNQHTIQELVSDNWIEFTRLIRRLTQDYDDSDKSNQAGEPSTRADAVGVSLGDESFPGHGGSGYTASHIVTLLIHTGYLTIGTGGAVRIPNGELRNMWERLWLLASFGTDDDEKQNTERRQLYGELFAGNVRGIFDSFQSAFTKLSNGANSYEEKALADILRSHVIGKLDHPRLLQKDGTISSASHSQQPDYVTEQESGYGKPDWVVKFPATKDRSQPFVIIVEFKRVTSKSRDSANGPLRLARAGLEQIIQKEYARPFDHYARRLDIGVAIGQGKVAMRQRLWTRVSGSPVEASNRKSNGMDPSISSTETVDEWDNRLVNADDAGWQDGLGWQTQRLEPSYRH